MSRPGLDANPLTLEAGWFNALFDEIGIDAEVKGLTAKSIGTGQIGENVRFVFDYARKGPNAPETLVGKFPSDSPESLMTAKMLGHYEREVNFYRTFPKVAGVITPKAFYTDYDAETNRFALIMEDMAPSEQGDQLQGCSVAEAERALSAAAVMHAAHWNDPALDTYAWLQGSELAPPPALAPEAVQGLWHGFKERYGDRLEADDILVGDAYSAVLPAWSESYEGPHALTHNDFRLDNMLFGADTAPKPLAVVDWQTAGKGAPAGDVAYFIGAGLTREDRPQHELALLRFYHARLEEAGIRDYPFEALYDHYRWFSFYGMSVAFGAAMLVKQTVRGDEMFLTMLRRHAAQARENDALNLLPNPT
ncbi:phosphotransferase [Hyphomonas atlantica corrig.]|uniref:phosphotransferase n=1 Tax=Hyphomonas atlantica TaxID=1280948 RepID=UPI0023577920|nr:phosphotransferase [Hyphomonas atlantica]